jgi:predicted ribosome quality control (RQC) complex YloA/Tae2 family protein
MVKELSAMDMNYLIREFQVLNNSKVDRIYHTKENPRELIIIMHVSGSGKHILRIMLPSLIFIDFAKESQGIATGLCMMLRKYLEGGILEEISQKGFERIIELKFRNKEEHFIIIIELFSKGNIIFCNSEYKILNLLESQKWKDRLIEREQIYQTPKNLDARTISEKEFIDLINNSSRKSFVKALAMDFSLGGKYAEELCALAHVDKEKTVKDISLKESLEVYKIFHDMLNNEIRAFSYEKNIYPFDFITLKDVVKKEYDNFNHALVENIDFVDDKQKGRESEKKKYDNIISEQEKTLSETENEYKENQANAEMIYKKYQEIDDIIKAIREARKKYGWKEIAKKILSDDKYNKQIISVDEKNHGIIIRIEDK